MWPHELITINDVPLLEFIANYLRSHTMYVSIAMITTTLAIYGGRIGKTVKKITHKMHILVRFTAYVFVYVFAIGFASTHAVRFLVRLLRGLEDPWLVLTTFVVFSVLTYLANNEKQI